MNSAYIYAIIGGLALVALVATNVKETISPAPAPVEQTE
jgi:hypothetical protein